MGPATLSYNGAEQKPWGVLRPKALSLLMGQAWSLRLSNVQLHACHWGFSDIR